MQQRETPTTLVWICSRYAVNPANICHIFRGTHGEIEVLFVGGRSLNVTEQELTIDGRSLLLPGTDAPVQLRLEPSAS